MSKKTDIRPYTKKELADLYEMSPHCFTTMIEPFREAIGKKKGWYFNVNQVSAIFEKAGFPGTLLNDEYKPKTENNKKLSLN
jgi:hypothetical protein